MKNGGKNKRVAFIILYIVFVYCLFCLFVYDYLYYLCPDLLLPFCCTVELSL